MVSCYSSCQERLELNAIQLLLSYGNGEITVQSVLPYKSLHSLDNRTDEAFIEFTVSRSGRIFYLSFTSTTHLSHAWTCLENLDMLLVFSCNPFTHTLIPVFGF